MFLSPWLPEGSPARYSGFLVKGLSVPPPRPPQNTHSKESLLPSETLFLYLWGQESGYPEALSSYLRTPILSCSQHLKPRCQESDLFPVKSMKLKKKIGLLTSVCLLLPTVFTPSQPLNKSNCQKLTQEEKSYLPGAPQGCSGFHHRELRPLLRNG